MPSAAQVLGASFISWIAWKVVRGLTAKVPFQNLPGPAPKTWFLGKFIASSCSFYVAYPKHPGNFVDLMGSNAWQFHADIRKNCKHIEHME